MSVKQIGLRPSQKSWAITAPQSQKGAIDIARERAKMRLCSRCKKQRTDQGSKLVRAAESSDETIADIATRSRPRRGRDRFGRRPRPYQGTAIKKEARRLGAPVTDLIA